MANLSTLAFCCEVLTLVIATAGWKCISYILSRRVWKRYLSQSKEHSSKIDIGGDCDSKFCLRSRSSRRKSMLGGSSKGTLSINCLTESSTITTCSGMTDSSNDETGLETTKGGLTGGGSGNGVVATGPGAFRCRVLTVLLILRSCVCIYNNL